MWQRKDGEWREYFSGPIPCEQISAGLLRGVGTTVQPVNRTPGTRRDRPLTPLPSPAAPPCATWDPSHPRGEERKAFSLLNPWCREPFFAGNGIRVDLAAPWAEQPDAGSVPCSHPLLCAVPHYVLRIPIISLGMVFNACVHHAPCHHHSSVIPNPRAHLALCCSTHARHGCPQTHVQHQAQRHLDSSLKQRSKPLLCTTPAQS